MLPSRERSTSTWAALIVATVAASGCASPSPRRDFARVSELVGAPLPAPGPGTGEPGPEVRALLEKPLTADSAARIALLQNPEVRAALHEVAAARGRAAQAGTVPNPAFEFDLRDSTDDSLPLQKDFYLEYELTRALLSPLRRGPRESEVQAEQLRAAGFALDLGFRARAGFYAWQAAQQRVAVANRTLDALAAGRDAARALYAAGNIPELELLTQEAAYESARATAAEVELAAIERREALQRLLGLHGRAAAWTAETWLPPADPPRPAEDVEAAAVRTSLDLAEARMRLEAAARRTGLAQAEGWVPDIRIDGHIEQDGREWERGGGMLLTVPLFDRQRGTLAAEEAQFDALAARYQQMAVEIRSAAREARDRLLSAYRRARHYTEVVVPARRRVVEHALRQVNAMAINAFELLRFQRELLDSELAATDALRDYWTARTAADALAAGRRPPAGAEGRAGARFGGAAAGEEH